MKVLFGRLDNILSGSSREFRILCIFVFLEISVATSVWTIFHMLSSLIVFANVVDHGSCLGSLLTFCVAINVRLVLILSILFVSVMLFGDSMFFFVVRISSY